MEHEILTIDDLAKLLRCSRRSIYNLTKARAKRPLPTLRLGIGLRWRRSDVEQWLER